MDALAFQREAARTVRINWATKHGPDIALLGVIGELGSLASVLKKQQRDQEAYANFKEHFTEELGDILWYVSTMANRFKINIDSWPDEEYTDADTIEITYALLDQVFLLKKHRDDLIDQQFLSVDTQIIIQSILRYLQQLAQSVGSNLSTIAHDTINKTLSYWGKPTDLPTRQFDGKFPDYEQLPRTFEIEFMPIEDSKTTIMRMNGVQLGDRLTDNSYEDDGYRFHDVFHIAGVGLLGWSPVFRSLLKAKRKSQPEIDEVEDGARAAIIEEAVINHIYDYARPNFLSNINRVDLDLIKRVQNLVRGYEVKDCEAWDWQLCILEGFRIFRELKESGSGTLIVDAERRTHTLRPL